jgi:hypothetical protein
VIEALLSVLKPIDAPGSIAFLVLCVLFSLVLAFVWPRSRRVARVWLLGVAGCYLVLALPLTAHAIAAALPAVVADDVAPDERLDALIVFDGDNRRGRVRRAAAAFAATRPDAVWILGEQWMLDELPNEGVPAGVIHQDAGTLNTREQMSWVARYTAEHPDARLALVASRLQMPRVAALRATARLDVSLLPSPVDDEPAAAGAGLIVPTYLALRVSRDAIYEHLALVYYRQKGWIR